MSRYLTLMVLAAMLICVYAKSDAQENMESDDDGIIMTFGILIFVGIMTIIPLAFAAIAVIGTLAIVFFIYWRVFSTIANSNNYDGQALLASDGTATATTMTGVPVRVHTGVAVGPRVTVGGPSVVVGGLIPSLIGAALLSNQQKQAQAQAQANAAMSQQPAMPPTDYSQTPYQ
ncbi:hypothetical protein J8273_0896 [Carpediemonas membranifera]|uniref:Uncharacterized protein n=1 Tax=Carpediemonas membranifera TaxID=201153 RepID=A0A8J6E4V6_9EUKA|nr:hypothetical protein J8273_0896 [Carpediemonas membranifera]|eukprot:KAG9397406.1 hypothetical protein J8273_0896 [Carpediemonas membranifera]